MLLQFGLGLPAAESNGARLLRGGMAVLPLPCMVIDASGGRSLVSSFDVFTHIRIVSQTREQEQGRAYPALPDAG